MFYVLTKCARQWPDSNGIFINQITKQVPPGGKFRGARDVTGQVEQARARANRRRPPLGKFRGARDVTGKVDQAEARANGPKPPTGKFRGARDVRGLLE